MGVFDTIRCERPLPDGCREQEFQTKSLDWGMETYRLTVQGRLLNAAGLDTGFHGVMRFYTHTPAGQWYEYEAKFTDGALQHLLTLEQPAYSPDGLARSATPPLP